MKLTMECQLVPIRQALCGRQSIELHQAPGPWGNERNQQLPTESSQTANTSFIHVH